MNKATLLLEIGTEELPPKALESLAGALAEKVGRGLDEAGIERGEARPLASPRRLAVAVSAVAAQAPDREIERLGPPAAAAFDGQGQPTQAAKGFARSCGVSVDDLTTQDTDKGERLAYSGLEKGQPLSDLFADIAHAAVRGLPIPKRMRWGESEAAFVRPVHWLVALHGASVLDLRLFGIEAGRTTYGHRFHHPEGIELSAADDYVAALRDKAYVMADQTQRREAIAEQVATQARALGGEALVDDGLLREVSALVEWPVALAGRFEERFLALPREVLISTLEGHQRYFPVQGPDGALLPAFITVANIESSAPEQVIAGNERVVRPRLADALFFWEQDRRQDLGSLAAGLERVTFQRELGSLAGKSARVGDLAAWLAGHVGCDEAAVTRSAFLAKVDLLTDMVGEFPELQGVMGRYYAEAAGEPPAVARALEEQYLPRAAGGPIPESGVGRALALADKLDTLAGIFAVGKRPSGEKDPFALRRAALGVLRIAIEGGVDFSLAEALRRAVAAQPVDADEAAVVADLLDFHRERLRAYFQDRDVSAEVFESVAAMGIDRVLDFDQRIRAVQRFIDEPAARTLCAAHKRIRNILKDRDIAPEVVPERLQDPAERTLYATLEELSPTVAADIAESAYADALLTLSRLGPPVDGFFDDVLVMADDERLRTNRLALLAALDAQCRAVADISRLSVET